MLIKNESSTGIVVPASSLHTQMWPLKTSGMEEICDYVIYPALLLLR